MSLFRSAATVSVLTLLSRISGLARDVLIARSFGSTAFTDAFWVAFRIPNLLRRLFAEGAFSQAFVPILGAYKAKNSEDEVRSMLGHVALILASALLLVSVLGAIFAPAIVLLTASGIGRETIGPGGTSPFDATVLMTRVMFPYIFCMSLVALASGVLNTWHKFAIPAFTPLLLNLSMIIACLTLTQFVPVPIYALAVGVMIGGILQLAIQWVALSRLGMLPKFNLSYRQAWSNPYVRRIIKQMAPATLGVSVAQISILINTNIASWLGAGSVSWLSFADRLMEFPTALLGVALGTVLLPSLSAAHAEGDQDRYSNLMDWGLRLVCLFGLPCMLGLALMGTGMVSTLFNYGEFSAQDVSQTQFAVCAYGFGLLGILAVKILAPGFYAQQDIRTPVKIAIIVLIATQLMNLAFVPWLRHAGLALSIGMGATLNALMLFFGLRRRKIYQPGNRWAGFLLKVLPALLVLAGCLVVANHYIVWTNDAQSGLIYWLSNHYGWFGQNSFSIWRLLLLFGTIGISGIAYFAVLRVLGINILQYLRKR